MLDATRNNDLELVIDRACRLDAGAFEVLVDEYAPRVRGFLRRIARTNDVDDLVQDVFLRMVRTIAGYRESGRFDAWVFQIARNVARDHLRQTLRRGSVGLTGSDQDGRMSPASIGHELEQAESARKVEAALICLPDAEREVILLRHFGRLTFEEIAELMDTPLGTALARSHRGLKKLRQEVEESE